MGTLPVSADAGHSILAFHETPEDDNSYLVEEVRDGQLVRGSVAGIRGRLGDVAARIVLCGHSHISQTIQLPGDLLILNPSSVGSPAYDDPGDDPYVSESGSPLARYAVLTIDRDQVIRGHDRGIRRGGDHASV